MDEWVRIMGQLAKAFKSLCIACWHFAWAFFWGLIAWMFISIFIEVMKK